MLVQVRHDHLHIVVDIVDQGAGMAPEFIRDELFQPFSSTKSGGHGIGAYQARELLRESGGDLLVLSRQGHGTTMRILLPALDAQEHPACRIVRLTRTRQMAKPKLLIVEDDEGLCSQYRWAFPDCEVVLAHARPQAINLVRKERPPVILLDLGLPPDPDGVSEGFATLDEILHIAPDSKVIVVTGNGERKNALKAVGVGAYDFCEKPVQLDVLRTVIDRGLKLFRWRTRTGDLQRLRPRVRRSIGLSPAIRPC